MMVTLRRGAKNETLGHASRTASAENCVGG
jgi:hypothetical protein